MARAKRGKPSDDELDKKLLAEIPADGTARSNAEVRGALGWQLDTYLKIRNRLLDAKKISLGRGRGGSVQRFASIAVKRPGGSRVQPKRRAPEAKLYKPMLKVLSERFPQEMDLGPDWWVRDTSRLGDPSRGGKWTRPDITAVNLRTYRYVPGKHLDLWTFEIKPKDEVNVLGVFEAAAHRRRATRSWVIFHTPEVDELEESDEWERICIEAAKVGVGVISAEKPNNYDTWFHEVEAERNDPDPQDLDDALHLFLSICDDDAKTSIMQRLH